MPSGTGGIDVQHLVDGRDDDLGCAIHGLRHRARWIAELAGDLRGRQAGQYLGVVLRAGPRGG
ncbi:MAG TPA: hypothetical protein VIY52_28070 [Streptosporangiaceae bacterium]